MAPEYLTAPILFEVITDELKLFGVTGESNRGLSLWLARRCIFLAHRVWVRVKSKSSWTWEKQTLKKKRTETYTD
jgi:hypothetical protein